MNTRVLAAMCGVGVSGAASAQVTCAGGGTHPTLSAALADAECTNIQLEAGEFREHVTIDRKVRIQGAGREATVLGCDAGPCMLVLPGASLDASALTVASRGTAISAWWARVGLADVRIAPIGSRGGLLKLRDTDATITDSDIDVVGRRPIAVQALSGRGHDLTLESVTFWGVEPASGTQSAVYSNAYGVVCADCRFVPDRPDPPLPETWLALAEPEPVTQAAPTDTTRWPSLFCPHATEQDLARCLDQCGDRPVGHCKMSWDQPTERCLPEAVCVDDGELPHF